MKRTIAVIVRGGYPVAQTETNGATGEIIRYGTELVPDNLNANREKNLVSYCSGKISRANKYLNDNQLLYRLPVVFCEGPTATLICND